MPPVPAAASLELVVAVADNGVIGRELGLPWRQRADLRHFKALTLGHPILMGRRTFESIGRALPGRANLVLSRSGFVAPPGVSVVPSLEAALGATQGSEKLCVIGGAVVYREALPLAAVIHLTEIHGAPEGDVSFPAFARSDWQETARERFPADADNDYPYSFVTLRRARAG